MKIPSEDVIQADSLSRLDTAIEAVARGARTDKDIAAAIGNLDARQGRYYRRAGETMGFLRRIAANESALDRQGREYVRASATKRRELLIQAVLRNALFQRLLPFLESKGPTGASRNEIEQFLGKVAALGTATMVERRTSTYIRWLVELGLGGIDDSRLVLNPLPPFVPILNYVSDEEPISPKRYTLQEYKEQADRVQQHRRIIVSYIDAAARERASASHRMLVNMMAERLRGYGAIPKANRFIDLSARVADTDYLFEMKSTTEGNFTSQIRRGLSQLYEYRYIEQIPDSRLVLVLQSPLPTPAQWMKQYLEEDRNVLLVWDGRNQYFASAQTKRALPYLS
jgi:hypothetical protein